MWLDLDGSNLANTVYCEGTLVAKDVVVNLPAVTPKTADLRAMGTLTMPMLGQIEAMEASITKIGVDKGLRKLVKFESKTLEFRWVKEVKKADGTTDVVGLKAFLRVTPKTIPGISVDPGNIGENELTYSVSRYQLFVDGEEYWLIDQLNQILRIDGVDYCKDIRSLL